MEQHTSSIGHSSKPNSVDMIVVCPHDPTSFSMWADGSNIDIVLKIHNKMMPYIENKYSIRAERSSRFIQGFPMGGFGVLAHGLKYPEKFSKIIIWDGALHDWKTLSTMRKFIASRQFDNSEELFSEWSPYTLAETFSSSMSLSGTDGTDISTDALSQTMTATTEPPSILMFSGGMSITDKLASKYKTTLEESDVFGFVHIKTKIGHNLKDFLKCHDRDALEFLGLTAAADGQ